MKQISSILLSCLLLLPAEMKAEGNAPNGRFAIASIMRWSITSPYSETVSVLKVPKKT